MNNRLDFISKFRNQDLAIEAMTEIRKEFIKLDDYLRALASSDIDNDSALLRSVALARTHLEDSLQHTIKSLCLLWEDK